MNRRSFPANFWYASFVGPRPKSIISLERGSEYVHLRADEIEPAAELGLELIRFGDRLVHVLDDGQRGKLLGQTDGGDVGLHPIEHLLPVRGDRAVHFDDMSLEPVVLELHIVDGGFRHGDYLVLQPLREGRLLV